MLIFGLFIFVMMLMVGSLAVDFMRLESQRARLQSTIDRAALAAADLTQTLDQKEVILDYVTKAGLKDNVTKIEVVDNGNERSAFVSAEITLDTLLMQFIGIDTLQTASASKADERTPHIEISMVLDVSGSMNTGNRIGSLKTAAKKFVETTLPETQLASDPAIKSISIIPYNATVVAGPRILKEFNVSDDHAFSHCVFFEDKHFETTALSTTEDLIRYPHYDPRNKGYERHPDPYYIQKGINERRIAGPLCNHAEAGPNGAELNPILPMQTDRQDLIDHIDSFVADGATGIDIGVKWGLAFLDPSLDDAVTNLIADNTSDTLAAGRPFDFDSENSRKIMVLMTDGKMNAKANLLDVFRKGSISNPWNWSNVFFSPAENDSSLLLRGTRVIRIASTTTNDLMGDYWFWIDAGQLMPFADTPAAKVPLRFEKSSARLSKGNFYWNARNNESGLTAYVYEHGTPDEIALWEKRKDWNYLGDPGLTASLTPGSLVSYKDQLSAARIAEQEDERFVLERLTHPQVFNRWREWPFVNYIYKKPYQNGWLSEAEWALYSDPSEDESSNSNSSTRMIELCRIARGLKADGSGIDESNPRRIKIYTVAMDVGEQYAKDLMKACATDESHFFDITQTEIVDVFEKIAEDVNDLRLTQ
ncbi:pilus assembly protein TadG-related protein [Aestuariibius insulae]|uniref:pilus assembly protein TadG-related protein n=1 Tax=Aestuariibius insulae TaxID=2058287 RepID=UPI00345EF36F